MARPPDGTFKLSLIGGFTLARAGQVRDLADPARRLLAFLALRRRAQPRVLVAGCLWPDKPEARALANLRSALWTLHGPGGAPVIAAEGPSLRLSSTVLVDVQVVQAQGWSLIEHSTNERADVVDSDLVNDKDLLFEDLLPGWYDDWVLLERERFAELQIHTLDVVIETLSRANRHSQAINMALRLVALDPLREPSQLALIQAYLAEGSYGRARRQHRAFCDLMVSSFGRDFDRSFDDVLDVLRERGTGTQQRDSVPLSR